MIKIPTHKDLIRPTIGALKALGGSGSIQEIDSKIIELGDFSEEVLNFPNTDGRQTKLENRAAWARSYLKRSEAVENSRRGVWSLTKDGMSIDDEEIEKRIKAYKDNYRGSDKTSEDIDDALQEDDEPRAIGQDWKSKLLDLLKTMDPSSFERLTQRVLRESGFVEVNVTGRPNDGGIDGSGILRMNLITFPVLFQCKRFKQTVGPSVVRDFRGAMHGRADKGLIITTGTFTSEAKKESRRGGALSIDLIDGDDFCALLKDLKLGISTELIEKISINEEWFDRFDQVSSAATTLT